MSEKVFSKDEFVTNLAENISKVTGKRVSKAKAWEIYKVAQATAFQMAVEKPVSLAGIGKYRTMISGRSGRAKMKFTSSSRVDEILNGDKNYLVLHEGHGHEETAAPVTAAPSAAPAAAAPSLDL